MQAYVVSPIKTHRYNYINHANKNNVTATNNENYTKFPSGLEQLAKQNIVFLSKKDRENDLTTLPKYDKNLVGNEAEGHFSFYLRNNPEKFYYKNDKEINNFLRTGYLPPVEEDEEYHLSDLFKDFVENEIAAKKDYNLAIVDSVDILDSMMTSKTSDIMVLSTKATDDWEEVEAGDVIGERGYFEAVDISRLSKEDAQEYKDAVEVIVPEGTPYMEIDKKGKQLMVFPRGMKYLVLDEKNVEMLGK